MKKVVTIFLMVVCGTIVANKSHAAFTIYMKLVRVGGAQILGESTAKGYENDVEITSESQSASDPLSISGTGGSGVGKVTINDFSFQTILSSVSIPLTSLMYQGTRLLSVDLYYVNTGCNCAFYKVHMENVYITSIADASSGETIQQQFTLAPLQLAWAYYKQNINGTFPSTPTNQFAWNRATGAVWNYSF